MANEVFYEKIKNNWQYIILISLFIFPPIIFSIFNVVPAYSDKTYNIIVCLIQIEAAVIAVVISLSLVAVQLAAQTYSARVIEIIRGNTFFLIIIIAYIITISYGIFIMLYLDNSRTYGIQNLVLTLYCFSFLIFMALIPLFLSILNSLMPSKMIDKLAEKITSKNLEPSIDETKKFRHKNHNPIKIIPKIDLINSISIKMIPTDIKTDQDPIIPIVDIIQASIIKNDFETIKYGFKKINNRLTELLRNTKEDSDKEIILSFIFTYLSRIGVLAVEKEDEDVVHELILLMNHFTRIAIDGKFIEPIILSIDSYTKIIRIAIKKELEYSSLIYTLSIGGFGRILTEKKFKDVIILVINSLMKIGRLAIFKDFDDTIYLTTSSLVAIVITAPAEYKIRNGAIYYIGLAGKYSAKNHIDYLINESIFGLRDISEIVIDEEDFTSLRNITKNLLNILLECLKSGSLNDLTMYGNIFIEIALDCLDKGLDEEVRKIQKNLFLIAQESLKYDYDLCENIISQYLFTICKLAILSKILINNSIREIPIIYKDSNPKAIENIIKKYKEYGSNFIIKSILVSIIDIAKLTADMKRDNSTNQILDFIFEIYIYGEIDNSYLLCKIKDLCNLSVKNNLFNSTTKIIDFMIEIIRERLKTNQKILTNTIPVLTNIGNLIIEKESKEDFSIEKNKFKKIYLKIVDSLIEFGKLSIKNDYDQVKLISIALKDLKKTGVNLENVELLDKIKNANKEIGEYEMELDKSIN